MKTISTLLTAAALLLVAGPATLPLAVADEAAAPPDSGAALLPADLARAVASIPVLSVPDALARLREHGSSEKREALLATLDRWEKEYAADPKRFVREFEMTGIFENVPMTNPDELAPLIAALIREGASLGPGGLQETPLMMAASNHAYRCAQLFLAHGVPVNAQNGDSFDTAFTRAVAVNDLPMMKLLLAHGAEMLPNCVDGHTPLMTAAGYDALDAARFLLEMGANVNEESLLYNTPLDYAAHAGATAMLRFLLEQGAAVDGSPRCAETPLHCAVCGGSTECARILLDHGANVNAADCRGDTALILAAHRRSGTVDLVRLLLESGANVHHRNHNGWTALTPLGEWAASCELPEPKPEVKELLQQ